MKFMKKLFFITLVNLSSFLFGSLEHEVKEEFEWDDLDQSAILSSAPNGYYEPALSPLNLMSDFFSPSPSPENSSQASESRASICSLTSSIERMIESSEQPPLPNTFEYTIASLKLGLPTDSQNLSSLPIESRQKYAQEGELNLKTWKRWMAESLPDGCESRAHEMFRRGLENVEGPLNRLLSDMKLLLPHAISDVMLNEQSYGLDFRLKLAKSLQKHPLLPYLYTEYNIDGTQAVATILEKVEKEKRDLEALSEDYVLL